MTYCYICFKKFNNPNKFCIFYVFYVPCVYQRQLWYVILVTPLSRTIFADIDAKILVDLSIPCTDHEVEVEGVEVDKIMPTPTTS